MATNNGSQISIENVIRRIVREELKQSFTFNFENASGNETEDFQVSSGTAGQKTSSAAGKQKVGQSKGRVTKPTDRRLKQNREV